MKTRLLSYLCLFASLTIFVSADDISSELKQTPSQTMTVIRVSDLKDNGIEEIMQGLHPDVAVEFTEKMRLPISLFLSGDLVKFIGNEKNAGFIEVQQTFYIRRAEDGLFFSTNLTEWNSFLAFITGRAAVELNVEENRATIKVGAEVNHWYQPAIIHK